MKNPNWDEDKLLKPRQIRVIRISEWYSLSALISKFGWVYLQCLGIESDFRKKSSTLSSGSYIQALWCLNVSLDIIRIRHEVFAGLVAALQGVEAVSIAATASIMEDLATSKVTNCSSNDFYNEPKNVSPFDGLPGTPKLKVDGFEIRFWVTLLIIV